MNNLSSFLNQHHQLSSLLEIDSQNFDPTSSSHEDFLEQMLSSVPSSGSSFPWTEDTLEDQSATVLASKLRQHQISNKAMMLHQQQQMFLSRDILSDQNDVVDGSSYKSSKPEDDASVKALFNGFGQTSNQPQHFHQPQNQEFGTQLSQPAMSGGSSGGAAAGQPRQRVRARRGQATDPHSIAERLRRERIAERMKALQELVPNGNKTDKASMLDEIIDYVKFLQLQVKVLSMSRLGGAGAVPAPLAADMSSEGKSGNGIQTTSSSNYNDGTTATENQVAKMLEEDMGSAMQYLQGKGLCLMPISLASAISTATCQTRNPFNGTANAANGEAGGSTSPNMSALTVQSSNIGGVGGEISLKDVTSVTKP